jgi:hypothetical protein
MGVEAGEPSSILRSPRLLPVLSFMAFSSECTEIFEENLFVEWGISCLSGGVGIVRPWMIATAGKWVRFECFSPENGWFR